MLIIISWLVQPGLVLCHQITENSQTFSPHSNFQMMKQESLETCSMRDAVWILWMRLIKV